MLFKTMEEGKLVSLAKDEKAQSVYEMYYDYEEPVKKAEIAPSSAFSVKSLRISLSIAGAINLT